ncbi:MAG: hypothetical protein PVG56_12880 [Anaerolineae bacterium]
MSSDSVFSVLRVGYGELIQEARVGFHGDVLIIPTGVAHKNLGSSPDFGVVGAYPRGQRPDMNYGRPGERLQADERIAGVPLPQADPVFGGGGLCMDHWLGLADRS